VRRRAEQGVAIASRVLVTGATGFVGKELVTQLLASGREVRALVRDRARALAALGPNVELVVHALGDGALPSDVCAELGAVIHLAGHAHAEDEGSGRSDQLHRSVTVEGTRALLESASQARVPRFVFLSSVKAIGESTGVAPNDGSAAFPTTAYGRAKHEAERLVLTPRDAPLGVVLRSPLVYGPGVKGNLRQMMIGVSRGRFPPLPETHNRRSLIDVRDLVSALLLLEREPLADGRTFIATDGEPYSTRRIYEAMCSGTRRGSPSWSIPLGVLQGGARVGDVLKRLARRPMPLDSERLGKLLGSAHYSNAALVELGFQPKHRLESSLPEMVAAWRTEAS